MSPAHQLGADLRSVQDSAQHPACCINKKKKENKLLVSLLDFHRKNTSYWHQNIKAVSYRDPTLLPCWPAVTLVTLFCA